MLDLDKNYDRINQDLGQRSQEHKKPSSLNIQITKTQMVNSQNSENSTTQNIQLIPNFWNKKRCY